MMPIMAAYEGPGVLRYWVNRSTVLLDAQVKVTVRELPVGWEVSVSPTDLEQAWAMSFMPNPWSLVFPDGSAFEVGIEPIGPNSTSWRIGTGPDDEWMPDGPVATEWILTEWI